MLNLVLSYRHADIPACVICPDDLCMLDCLKGGSSHCLSLTVGMNLGSFHPILTKLGATSLKVYASPSSLAEIAEVSHNSLAHG